MYRLLKALPDQDKIRLLKFALGLTVTNLTIQATIVELQSRQYKKLQRNHTELYQITKILLDNTDLERNPELAHKLKEYIEFVEIMKTSEL